VVLGQGHGSDTLALLAAAGEAAEQLVDFVAPAIHVRAIAAPGAAGGRGQDVGPHATGSYSLPASDALVELGR